MDRKRDKDFQAPSAGQPRQDAQADLELVRSGPATSIAAPKLEIKTGGDSGGPSEIPAKK